jgi:hypothetical protein
MITRLYKGERIEIRFLLSVFNSFQGLGKYGVISIQERISPLFTENIAKNIDVLFVMRTHRNRINHGDSAGALAGSISTIVK